MRDVTTEIRDLHVSVIRADTSQMSLSHVVSELSTSTLHDVVRVFCFFQNSILKISISQKKVPFLKFIKIAPCRPFTEWLGFSHPSNFSLNWRLGSLFFSAFSRGSVCNLQNFEKKCTETPGHTYRPLKGRVVSLTERLVGKKILKCYFWKNKIKVMYVHVLLRTKFCPWSSFQQAGSI
jgi:hypothetical protein